MIKSLEADELEGVSLLLLYIRLYILCLLLPYVVLAADDLSSLQLRGLGIRF